MIDDRLTANAHETQGASYDLLGEAFHHDPNPTLHRMRAADPVYWHPVLDAWVLTTFGDVAYVVQDPTFSVDRGGSISKAAHERGQAKLDWCSHFVLQWMVFSDPPRHTRLRASVSREFGGRAMANLRAPVRALVDELLSPLERRTELLSSVAAPLPALVTCQLLGLPREDVGLLKKWTADMFRLFGAGVADDEVIDRAYTSLRESCDYFRGVVATRRSAPGDDLLSALVRSEDTRSTMSETELLGMCVTLVAGAFETTTHLIGNGLLALLQHPQQLELLRRKPHLMANAVEELMRYDGPAMSVVRRATCDVEVRGTKLREGERIYCMLHAANHDPARHSDPDRLDIQRDDPKHLGFGHGMHFCLGAALTRLETSTLLHAMLERFPTIRLDEEALGGRHPRRDSNLSMRGLHELPLILQGG